MTQHKIYAINRSAVSL